jgi:hypothetical protein
LVQEKVDKIEEKRDQKATWTRSPTHGMCHHIETLPLVFHHSNLGNQPYNIQILQVLKNSIQSFSGLRKAVYQAHYLPGVLTAC